MPVLLVPLLPVVVDAAPTADRGTGPAAAPTPVDVTP